MTRAIPDLVGSLMPELKTDPGTFAPPLDAEGNSVREQLAAPSLSRRLGLDLFGSEPDARGRGR